MPNVSKCSLLVYSNRRTGHKISCEDEMSPKRPCSRPSGGSPGSQSPSSREGSRCAGLSFPETRRGETSIDTLPLMYSQMYYLHIYSFIVYCFPTALSENGRSALIVYRTCCFCSLPVSLSLSHSLLYGRTCHNS